MSNDYLKSIKQQFEYYKNLGDKTFTQINDEKMNWKLNEESNSISTIVKHLYGNMLSRWTDFRTTDGEKEWRKRDEEFEKEILTKEEIIEKWNTGWDCLFQAINSLTIDDLETEIFIRNESHTITEAINRQLAHYPYHVGQIVFIGKMICDANWNSLSIPKGNSNEFNQEKFSKEKNNL
jgi:hypothetical protein